MIFAAPILMGMDVVGSLHAGFFAYVLCTRGCCVKRSPKAQFFEDALCMYGIAAVLQPVD